MTKLEFDGWIWKVSLCLYAADLKLTSRFILNFIGTYFVNIRTVMVRQLVYNDNLFPTSRKTYLIFGVFDIKPSKKLLKRGVADFKVKLTSKTTPWSYLWGFKRLNSEICKDFAIGTFKFINDIICNSGLVSSVTNLELSVMSFTLRSVTQSFEERGQKVSFSHLPQK